MDSNETIETPEIPDTAAEVIDMFNRGAEPEAPAYHTILEVWREVLVPATVEATKKPAPPWAAKMVQLYPQLSYPDCVDLRDRYFAKLQSIRDIIDLEIAANPGCLDYTTAEDDVAENTEIYESILMTWQALVLQWELEWDCTATGAAAELASISEAHKTMFGDSGRSGLSAFLDNIKFEYLESTQATISEALTELRDNYTDEVAGE